MTCILNYWFTAETPKRMCHAYSTLSHSQLHGSRSVFTPLLYHFSWLFKINNFGTNRKGECDFLLLNSSNFGRILYRFSHNCITVSKIRWFHTVHCHFTRLQMTSVNLCTIFTSLKSTDMELFYIFQSLIVWVYLRSRLNSRLRKMQYIV